MTTDPVADLLTRIRNANMAGLDTVEAPVSRLKANIARVLKDEGFIKNFPSRAGRQQTFFASLLKSGNRQESDHGHPPREQAGPPPLRGRRRYPARAKRRGGS